MKLRSGPESEYVQETYGEPFRPSPAVPSEGIRAAALELPTPAVIWDDSWLNSHLATLRDVCQRYGVGFSTSVKATNSIWALHTASRYTSLADVQSVGEFAMARSAQFESVSATGPGFRPREIALLLSEGVAYDAESWHGLSHVDSRNVGIRLRVKVPDNLVRNPRSKASRFGLDSTPDTFAELERRSIHPIRIRLATSESDVKDVGSVLEYKMRMAANLRNYLPHLEQVNLGGGMLELSRTKDGFEHAIARMSEVRRRLEHDNGAHFESIWIEPSAALFLDAAFMLTEVLDYSADGPVIDASPWNIAPWTKSIAYSVNRRNLCTFSGNLYGPSHYEADLMTVSAKSRLPKFKPKVGDRILLSGFGAYTLVHGRTFGAFPMPNSYAATDSGVFAVA